MSNLSRRSRRLAAFALRPTGSAHVSPDITTPQRANQVGLEFAQRLFSRQMKGLHTNQGVFNLCLSADAKINASFWCFVLEDRLLLITEDAQRQSLPLIIERYHFSEAFQVEPESDWMMRIEACETDSTLKAGYGEFLMQHKAHGRLQNLSIQMERVSEMGANPKTAGLTAAEAAPIDQTLSETEDILRMSEGLPLFGYDYDAETLVFDIGFERYCDENKGCYVGQEIIERVRSRGGQGPRKLFLVRALTTLAAGSLWLKKDNPQLSMTMKSSTVERSGQSIGLAIGPRQFKDGDELYESNAKPERYSAKIAKTF